MSVIQEKVDQATNILRELEIDLWLTFVRETTAAKDPALPLIYGKDLTWQSALLIHKSGNHTAIVGRFETEAAKTVGVYQQVIGYDESIQSKLLGILDNYAPHTIAINYSMNDAHADGLGYGLFQLLHHYLNGTTYINKLVSAETLLAQLRGQKTPTEVKYIRDAIHSTEIIYANTFKMIKPGISEKEIAGFMHSQMELMGLLPAWEIEHCPAVNSGPNSPVGHSAPTDIRVEPGHVIHFDFGIKQSEYCSDIQRVAYVLRKNETQAPEQLLDGFDTIVRAIQTAVSMMKPGKLGYEIDQIAREIVVSAGFPEYKYATGHHLGRTVHDGAGILGPRWTRYGNTPNYKLAAGQVYTIEPGLFVDDFGYISLEENVLVTREKTIFLSKPQTKIILI